MGQVLSDDKKYHFFGGSVKIGPVFGPLFSLLL